MSPARSRNLCRVVFLNSIQKLARFSKEVIFSPEPRTLQLKALYRKWLRKRPRNGYRLHLVRRLHLPARTLVYRFEIGFRG